MTKVFAINGTEYKVVYDKERMSEILDYLGIEVPLSKDLIERATVYYSAAPNRIRTTYMMLAREDNVTVNSIEARITRGLTKAVYNGKLKQIDDLYLSPIYDYDYGFTSKAFISLMSDYMQSQGYLKVEKTH